MLHESTFVRIEGNVHVEQTIFGDYNDGSLHIKGKAQGEVWITNDHDMYAAGGYDFIGEGDRDWGFGDLDWINPQLLDSDDCLINEVLFKFVYEGKSLIREDFVPKPKQEPIVEPEVPEEPEIEAPPYYDPELIEKLNVFSVLNDNMGLTRTLVDWPKKMIPGRSFVNFD